MQNFQILIVYVVKSVNNVCKLLQLLGDEVLQITYRSLLGDFRPQTPWALAPQMKVPVAATEPISVFVRALTL